MGIGSAQIMTSVLPLKPHPSPLLKNGEGEKALMCFVKQFTSDEHTSNF